jgi:hypothetical protein
MKTFGALSVLLTSLALVGCSSAPPVEVPKTVAVKGKVLLPNGQPLTQGRLVLVPTDPSKQEANGQIGKDGSFALTSYKQGDGAVPGEYKIKIEDAPTGVPKKYLSAGGETVTVSGDRSDYMIKLTN